MEKAKIDTTKQSWTKELSKDEVRADLKLIEEYVDNLVNLDYVHWDSALYAYLLVIQEAAISAIVHIGEYKPASGE